MWILKAVLRLPRDSPCFPAVLLSSIIDQYNKTTVYIKINISRMPNNEYFSTSYWFHLYAKSARKEGKWQSSSKFIQIHPNNAYQRREAVQLNWPPVAPTHSHVPTNTRTFTRKSSNCGHISIISTCPLPTRDRCRCVQGEKLDLGKVQLQRGH